MSVSQLIYTDCNKGRVSTGTGFQIYSYSKGMEDIYFDPIHCDTMCKYVAPNTLPAHPTEEQIAELCPIRYTYEFLDHKKAFISRNHYLDLDRMGRSSGNLFSHVIGFDREELEVYPISLFDSDLFFEDISMEEKNDTREPRFLDSLHKDQLSLSRKLDITAMLSFFENNAEKLNVLRMMITATYRAIVARATDSGNSKKTILINDVKENIPYWIAGITYAFPLELAKQITFTTYSYNPYLDGEIILGVQDNTLYNPDNPSNKTKYYIFDFINHIFSEDIESKTYGEEIERAYTKDPLILDMLFDFLDKAKYDFSQGAIDDIGDAYRMYLNDIEDWDNEKLIKNFEYVNSHVDRDFRAEYYRTVLQNFKQSKSLDVEEIYWYIQYAVKAKETLKDPALAILSAEIYWMKLRQLVLNYETVGEDNINRFVKMVAEIDSDFEALVMDKFLEPTILQELVRSIKDQQSVFANGFWWSRLLLDIDAKEISIQDYAVSCDKILLSTLVYNLGVMKDPIPCMDYLLRAGLSDGIVYELFKAILREAFYENRKLYLMILDAFCRYFKTEKNLVYVEKIYQLLTVEDEMDAKTSLAEFLITNADDSFEMAHKLRENALKYCPDFWKLKKKYLYEKYYKFAENSSHRLRRYCCFLIDAESDDKFRVEQAMRLFESTVVIDSVRENDVKDFSLFGKLLKKHGIEYRCTKFFAALWISYFVSGKKLVEEVEKLSKCDFTVLSEEELQYAIHCIFELDKDMLVTGEEHKKVLTAFGADQFLETFLPIYAGYCVENIKKQPEVFKSLFVYLASLDSLNCLDILADAAVEQKVYSKEISALGNDFGPAEAMSWKLFLEKIEEKKKQKNKFLVSLGHTLASLKKKDKQN